MRCPPPRTCVEHRVLSCVGSASGLPRAGPAYGPGAAAPARQAALRGHVLRVQRETLSLCRALNVMRLARVVISMRARD
jgi:hypothetical protein